MRNVMSNKKTWFITGASGLLRRAHAGADGAAVGDEPHRPDERHPRCPAGDAQAALGAHHLYLLVSGPLGLRVRYRLRRVEVRPRGLFRTELLTEQSTNFAEPSIEDYDERRTKQLEFWKAQNGQQSGDPAKLARALIVIASQEPPPRRFIAGADAIATAEQRVADLKAQIDAERALSTSLAFD
jgi:hypothetical protein